MGHVQGYIVAVFVSVPRYPTHSSEPCGVRLAEGVLCTEKPEVGRGHLWNGYFLRAHCVTFAGAQSLRRSEKSHKRERCPSWTLKSPFLTVTGACWRLRCTTRARLAT